MQGAGACLSVGRLSCTEATASEATGRLVAGNERKAATVAPTFYRVSLSS